MSASILTRSYNRQRTGHNPHETILTQANVAAQGLVSYYSFNFEGDARGTEGATLLIPGVVTKDGLSHDLAFHGTMANAIYGHDANTGGELWCERIGNPVNSSRAMDMYPIADHWGILSCPEVDIARQYAFVVAMSSPDASFANASHSLHVIDLRDGSQPHPPISLSGATYQPPGSAPITFGGVTRKQRCALLLNDTNPARKLLYIACGSFLESADTNRGIVICVDVTAALKIVATWASSTVLHGDGIWMGGQGPSLDPATGDIFLTTGNGSFDGVTDWGESCMRLSAMLEVQDNATPFTDAGRVGGAQYQTLASPALIPAAARGAVGGMDGADDQDLNSGGPVLILASVSGLSRDLVFFAGKDGIGYLVDAANMGGQRLADFDPARIQANVYGKFLAITGFTWYPGGVSITPSDLSRLPTSDAAGFTHHQHSTPVFFKSSVHGPMLFTWGENGNLRAFSLTETNGLFAINYLACSAEVASPWCTTPPGGMPGGMLSLTSNGEKSGTALLWACVPLGNANSSITPGRLLAYDPENFATFGGGGKQLTVLWDSLRYPGIKFSHNKFCPPHVANGKIFCPTYDGSVAVWQLKG